MPIQPAYKTLDVYYLSKRLVVACYELTHDLPPEEKTNLVQYIRNAGVTVHLNIAQGGFFKKKKKRKQFIKTVKNALVVLDTAVQVLIEVKLVPTEKASELRELASACYTFFDDLKKQK
ncbi:four helix bundle protein [Flavisolibacter ginsengisoli]|jgi:four helix bundle protein|uniref:Four helix bundle protein n=1 Tax=Flavisolibacter ginsengisoli DSM 18119 TaxID=1121884 RepID=A0A1M5B344_9BACT|nr:four helix bundle protein [Flavisolibacter ginsengisoli]SHF36889.1 four helix bundle protein [Flavisolibacter ginsengisoli DSM 18119]